MSPTVIKAIFTNLLFVLGVILLIFGLARGVSTMAKLVIFDEYPLQTWEEQQCDQQFYGPKIEDEPNANTPVDPEHIRQECLQKLDQSRKVKLVEDISLSIVLLISGSALTLSFRRFILGSKS